MGQGKGDETARSGPRANVNLGGIDRSKRNLNTGERNGRELYDRNVRRKLTKSRSKEWFGTRDSRYSYMVVVTGREG